jgi:predicted NUDIX family NTP pyrophosphohydrolase
MKKRSAGLLVFRRANGVVEVFLVHPGGPIWAKKDKGAWSIPKGEIGPDEDPFATAKREFAEETGFTVEGNVISLGEIRQSGGKLVQAWAIEGDFDPSMLKSNTFMFQGREFPEVDRGEWFSLDRAREAANAGQVPFLDRLQSALGPIVS